MMIPNPHACTRLSEEEMGNPTMVIFQLFEFGNLVQLRRLQQESFHHLVCGSWDSLSPEERSGLACLQEHLEKLVEACHLLQQQAKEGFKIQQQVTCIKPSLSLLLPLQ